MNLFGEADCEEMPHNPLLQIIFGLTSVLSQRHKHFYQYVRCLGKCDTETFCKDLEAAPWGVIDSFESIDDLWDYWRSFFIKVVDMHILVKKIRVRSKTFLGLTML